MTEFEDIARESDKLQRAVSAGLEEYDNSASLQGKSWFAIGLESEEADQAKDSEAKKNILMKIIEKIVNFIKAIGAKIAEWFQKIMAKIQRFFGKKEVTPQAVAQRFDMVAKTMHDGDAAELVAGLSEHDKKAFIEILDENYSKSFGALIEDYKHLQDKAHDLGRFTENYEFFTAFKEKSEAVKSFSSSGLYENLDDKLTKILSNGNHADAVSRGVEQFLSIRDLHAKTAESLQKVLEAIPNDDLAKLEGDNVEAKRQQAVQLVSEVVKIEAMVIRTASAHMQVYTTIMGKIIKKNFKKIGIIPH